MILNNYGIRKSYTAEIVPSASDTSLTWQFPDLPFLRDKLIAGIVLSTTLRGANTGLYNYGYYVAADTATPGGVAPSGSFITLADSQGRQFIQNMPLKELVVTTEQNNATSLVSTNYYYGSNTNGIMYIDPRIIVWTKSYIYLPVATGTANLCCQFTIFYQ